MLNEVPQWLVQAFVRSAQAAGSTQSKEELAAKCHRLIEAWSSQDRSYHGLQHVVDLLTRLETLLPETRDPALVRLAAWFHGVCFSTSAEATYTHNGGENEEESALVAQRDLSDLGVDPEKAARVATLIRGLRIKGAPSPTETSKFQAIDIDEQALRDAHLGTLAVEPQRYKRYLELVKKEYSHIPHEDFLRARRTIVSKLLARRQLFVTPLARQWDEAARENLSAELQRLNDMLPDTEQPAPQAPSTVREKETTESGDDIAAEKPADKPSMIDSLLTASQNEEAAEQAAAQREAARLSRVEAETAGQLSREDTVSSLESCVDKLDPGVKEAPALTPEQRRQRRREEISAQMRQRIVERNRAADTARMERTREREPEADSREPRVPGTKRPASSDHEDPTASQARVHAVPASGARGTETEAGTDAATGESSDSRAKEAAQQRQSEPPEPVSRERSADLAHGTRPDTAHGASPGAAHGADPGTVHGPLEAHPRDADEAPQRVSIWGRLSDSPASADTPEWIDDEEYAEHRRERRASAKKDWTRDIPHLTDDDSDVRPSDLPSGPSHGIEKEPEI
ncbi:hypothetical protein VR010_15195 [Actinomycetaceae bacterium L2_0104]